MAQFGRAAKKNNAGKLILSAVWLTALCFAGGASRSDDLHQFAIRATAIFVLAFVFWSQPKHIPLDERRSLIFLGLAALLVSVQLVPLPYALWASLPGHFFFSQVTSSLGVPAVWRPISLTPGLTFNSLCALLPVLTTVMIFYRIVKYNIVLTNWALVAVAIIGAVLGLLQVLDGQDSALRFYSVTNSDSAVGFFANRNHHSVFLASGIVLLAPLSLTYIRRSLWFLLPVTISWAFLVLSILSAGSRAGLIAGIFASVMLLFTCVRGRLVNANRATPRRRLLIGGGAAVLTTICSVAIGVVLVNSGHAPALTRILSGEDEGFRRDAFASIWAMMTDFFPFGSGFGSFDPVFRHFEPMSLLASTYANQAHNDLMQVAIEGGLPALVLLMLFMVWWGKASASVYRAVANRSGDWQYRLAGLSSSGIYLVASLADYPLRTPLCCMMFAIGCGLMDFQRSSESDEP